MPQAYATITSGRTHVSLFPCLLFRPDNFYGKVSLRLQEQEQQRNLQKPNFPDSGQAGSAPDSTVEDLIALAGALTDLGVEVQCTISDPKALTSSLVSSKTCSKQALKKLAAMLKPMNIKPAADLDDALGDTHLQHLLHSLQSKAVMAFERSCETVQLQTPLLSQTSVQVELLTSTLLSPVPHTPVCGRLSKHSLALACTGLHAHVTQHVTTPSDDMNKQ